MDCEERWKFRDQGGKDGTLIRLIHVPLASFDRNRHERWAFLSPSEFKQADRYRSESRRNAYVAGRAALRLVLSRHGNCPAEFIGLRRDRHGKPFVRWSDGRSFTGFNLSHSPSLLALGITPGEGIGVDVEDFHQQLHIDVLVRNFFSAPQQEQWLNHSVEERERAFLRGWTRKEAAWKLFGNDGFVAWNDVEVALDDAPYTRARATTATGEWLLLDCYTWQPSACALASVVIRRHPSEKLRFDIQSIDFDALSELVWTSGAAHRSETLASSCLERSSSLPRIPSVSIGSRHPS